MNRYSGESLSGWPHVVQSLEYLFAVPVGSRVMRRTVGSAVPAILGRENLTPPALGRFYAAIVLACELWEPRFKLKRVVYPADVTNAAGVRSGRLGVRLIGEYRPNALFGDLTVAEVDGLKDFVL